MKKKVKVIMMGLTLALVVCIVWIGISMGAFNAFTDEGAMVREAKRAVLEEARPGEEIDFKGKAKVEYNKDYGYYVVSGYADVTQEEYGVVDQGIYLARVDSVDGDWKAVDIVNPGNRATEDFVEFFEMYDDIDEDDDDDEY